MHSDHPIPRPHIDAYAHVGVPRFGTAEQVVEVINRWDIDKAVLVLGPNTPDLEALIKARKMLGSDRVRLIGIPFGNTEEQRREMAEKQMALGIIGMRLMPFELGPAKEVIETLGERGLWLFAINPYQSDETARFLLDWLNGHEDGRIASPHFLIPRTIDDAVDDPVLFRELLGHPRFHAILSRHGGVGSKEPYPHLDLRLWVEDIAECVTWERLMWGSEYPVSYWRNEQISDCREWIDHLGVDITPQQREAFLGGNADRLFFAEEPAESDNVELPDWAEEQYARESNVPCFPNDKLTLPVDVVEILMTEYLERNEKERELRFADHVAMRLTELIREE
jgi:hypothetical protein